MQQISDRETVHLLAIARAKKLSRNHINRAYFVCAAIAKVFAEEENEEKIR